MIDDSVTKYAIQNTNCIVCGTKFSKARASKLYCSKKCRQAAYYHKDKIEAIRNSESKGINGQILTFSMKEYKEYNKMRTRLQEYKKLQSHFRNVEEGSEEWKSLYNNPNCALTFEREKIPKAIWNLRLPDLSIEQWSFIKSIYPRLGLSDFAQLVCSLSYEFINQINFSSTNESNYKKETLLPIKNKYIHHLDKIVNGEVRFI